MNKFKQENIFSLKNKNILILGGMGLIGLNFADSLSSFGAKVFILDIKKSPNFKKSNNISYIKCDVTSESSLNKAFSEILKKKIKIHTLIYNVYSKPKDYYKKFDNYKYKTWNQVVKANLSGAFLSSQIAIKYFKKENIAGNLIFVLSTYGIVGPDLEIYKDLKAKNNIYNSDDPLTTPAVYSSTKSGLLGLAIYIATTHGKYKIRANTLTPGGIYDGQEKEFVNRYIKKVPLGRMAEVSDYNGAIVFLCSEASKYMTGANLIIDGGWTAW
jgi:NAD(P)-dependent dehydrogenase (short-subunit alcohol dehydrogenase family)